MWREQEAAEHDDAAELSAEVADDRRCTTTTTSGYPTTATTSATAKETSEVVTQRDAVAGAGRHGALSQSLPCVGQSQAEYVIL